MKNAIENGPTITKEQMSDVMGKLPKEESKMVAALNALACSMCHERITHGVRDIHIDDDGRVIMKTDIGGIPFDPIKNSGHFAAVLSAIGPCEIAIDEDGQVTIASPGSGIIHGVEGQASDELPIAQRIEASMRFAATNVLASKMLGAQLAGELETKNLFYGDDAVGRLEDSPLSPLLKTLIGAAAAVLNNNRAAMKKWGIEQLTDLDMDDLINRAN